MIRAFLYLAIRSAKNLWWGRIRRLRQPRYLIVSLIGGLYLLAAFGRSILVNRSALERTITDDFLVQYRDEMEILAALILFGIVAGIWVFASSRGVLRFSEAESQFLFPAPVPRRRLVHFKLLRSQLAILIGVLMSAFFLGRRITHESAWAYLFGGWMLLATLHLHLLGVSSLRAGLESHGWTGIRQRGLALLVGLLWGGALLIGLWHAIPKEPEALASGVEAALSEFVRVASSGWIGILLAPFRAMIRPLVLTDLDNFWMIATPAAMLFLAHYVWVIRSEEAFEEASAEVAERNARRREAGLPAREGILGRFAYRRVPFRLRSLGRPETALFWKNLIAQNRALNLRNLLVFTFLLALVVAMGFGSRVRSGPGTAVLAISSLSLAVMLLPLGASMVRNDLRQDLLHLDVLKTYPMSGTSLVLGEILAPAFTISFIQWALAVFGYGLSLRIPMAHFSISDRTWVLFAFLIVAPAVNLVTSLIQNAIVVLFPAWMSLGTERAQGFEASGQRLLTLTGATFAFLVFLLPAMLSAGICFYVGRAMGVVGYFPAAVVFAITLLIEVAIGVLFLGKVMDRLDPTIAGIRGTAE